MDVVDPDDLPLDADTLADLQAGLFDDDTAARLRRRIRADPEARRTMAALNEVRRDLAGLGAEPAPAVDPETVERITAGLPSPAAHAVRRGGLPRPARIGVAATGLAALLIAAWLGVSALLDEPDPLPSRPTTIEHITVSRPPQTIPLSDQQILALIGTTPDYGPLLDPRRLASCLSGLGYPPNARVLGARPVDIAGRPAVLLLLPGDDAKALAALAVAPTCSSVNTGLSADRIVHRP